MKPQATKRAVVGVVTTIVQRKVEGETEEESTSGGRLSAAADGTVASVQAGAPGSYQSTARRKSRQELSGHGTYGAIYCSSS